ncbi:hypothetical protein HGA91_06355 [candidate division WWE3 bacterium]|nr:hypothetical protein [candidate division WWE3 bacterium]
MDSPTVRIGQNALRVLEAVQIAAQVHQCQITDVSVSDIGEDSVVFADDNPIQITIYNGVVKVIDAAGQRLSLYVEVGFHTVDLGATLLVIPMAVRLYGPSRTQPCLDWIIEWAVHMWPLTVNGTDPWTRFLRDVIAGRINLTESVAI